MLCLPWLMELLLMHSKTNFSRVKLLLDNALDCYLAPEFIQDDPIQIPHRFTAKEDIEIAGLLSATIAWGQRKSIIKNGKRIVELMGEEPHRFVLDHSASDLKQFSGFVHRTFNSGDLTLFIQRLKDIYTNRGGLESVFAAGYSRNGIEGALANFRSIFLSGIEDNHLKKHVADVTTGSACKRVNMFLRWMVRTSDEGVDFGIWDKIPASALHIPLDVHTANASRLLGILSRKQNDWRAVVELTGVLRSFSADDPIKYDFALFYIGLNKDDYLGNDYFQV